MSKFFFFTDPGLLDSQTAAQAFGPAGTSGGKDQFRVTDVHTSSSTDIPAFAICDGLVCAQTDDHGMLTLILKPSQQPSFNFPAISYILYKGIDPASLIASDGTIDTGQADNELITAIKAAWELAANNNTGSPSRACLGLHLNPTDYPATDNPARFADTQPLDTLFYGGDPAIQLPLARGSWMLGKFAAGSPFGIEIVVERIGRRPKIAVARKAENIVEVNTLAAGADDATVFFHWNAKEAILDFIDPCAFWGSFFAAKLRVWNGAHSDFDKLSGKEIYETVLRGTAQGAANFINRNRAIIDIRNEHGNSLNYYQADGPNIQLTLDAAADIDTCEINYYTSGWPSFSINNTDLPAGTTGDKIVVRFALPKTASTRPLIYISAGYRDDFKPLKDAKRFFDQQRRADVPYLEEAAIAIPLVDDTGTKIAASYQKLFSFKRPLIVNGLPASASIPGSLAPDYAGLLDHVFQVLPGDALPFTDEPTVVRTFGEERYVTSPTAEYGGFAARLTVARDATNRYWVLTPYAYHRWREATGVSDGASGSPSMAFTGKSQFLADYTARKTPRELCQIVVKPPQDAMTQSPVEVAIPEPGRLRSLGFRGVAFERTMILCLPESDIDQLLSGLTTDNPLLDSIFLSPGPSKTFAAGLGRYSRSPISMAYIKTSPALARETVATSLEIYADADL